jgi:hypothetical protein
MLEIGIQKSKTLDLHIASKIIKYFFKQRQVTVRMNGNKTKPLTLLKKKEAF